MKLGIITVTYNSHEVMAEFLHSVFAQTYTDWHLYIYDNDSTERMQDILADYDHTRYDFVVLDKNYGFAVANNIAIRKAFADGCDAVVVINNDTIFPCNLFVCLVNELNTHNALVVAPKMLYYPELNKIWYGGGYFDHRQALKNIHIGMDQVDDGNYDVAGWQDTAPMCCVLIKREAFERVGYLDENYFIYYEDTDWMYRAKLAHIHVWYAPNCLIYHKVSILTGGTKSYFTVYHATRSKIYFIRKFYSGIKRDLWLASYFAGFFIGLVLRRYTWQEFRVKISAFFSTTYNCKSS